MATIQVDPHEVISRHLIAYKCINTDCGFFFTQPVGLGTFFCPCCKYATKPLFNYYELFGLDRDFTPGDLKNSYKRLSKKYHPDKTKEDVEEVFMVIRKGFDVLRDETERELYDYELYVFDQFLAGNPIEEEIASGHFFSSGGFLTFVLGLAIAGLSYYQTQDPYITGFGFMVWATVLFLWKEHFVNTIRLFLEVGFIGIIGYVFFKEEWTIGILLTITLFGYLIFKYLNNKKVARNT